MKITITSILFPALALLAAKPSAAQEEDQSTLRGLKAKPVPKPYTVVLNQNLVNPGVYYGDGNDNGYFVIATSAPDSSGNKVRIGLRAHVAFVDENAPNPAKPFEFIYETGQGVNGDTTPSGRPRWNFDYEFDSDVECPKGDTCTPLSTYSYEVAMDTNPTINTNWVTYEPINVAYADHYFGEIDSTEDTDYLIPATSNPNKETDYAAAINGGKYHVVQNSFNYGFLGPPFMLGTYLSLVNAEGIYDVVLSIKEKASGKLLAKAAIRVLVKDSTKCAARGKCFPTVNSDCNKANIGKFNTFFTINQKTDCQAFVAGIKQ